MANKKKNNHNNYKNNHKKTNNNQTNNNNTTKIETNKKEKEEIIVKEEVKEENKKADNQINSEDIAKLKEYAEEKTELLKLKDIQEQGTKSEYYNLLENDKNHTLLKIISIIIIIAISMFLVQRLVIDDSKFIFTSNITKIYERLANNLVKISNSDFFKNKYQLNGVLQINSDDNKYKEYTNYQYNIIFDLDKENQNYNFNFNINDLNNNKILDTSYLFSNNNYYLKLNTIYENTIKYDNNILNYDARINDLLRNYDLSKLNSAVKSIKNIINKHIDNKYLKKEKVDNNTSVTLTLTNKEYSTLLSKIIDDIKNNNNIINDLASTFRLSNKDVNTYLDKLLQDNLDNKFNTLKFKINTIGILNITTSYQLLIDDQEVFKLNVEDMTFELNYKDTHINFYKEDKYKANYNDIKLTFNELSYDKIDIDYTLQNNDYGNIHFDKYNKDNNKSGNISYSIVTSSNKNSFNFDYRFDNYSPIIINNTTDSNILNNEDYLTIKEKINDQIKIKSIANYINNIIDNTK